MKHALGMLIGCGLAFLLAFLLPAVGVRGNVSLLIFFLLMISCHLFIGHDGHGDEKQ
jgi:4-hydroxybenzoate polyprenyltransferase